MHLETERLLIRNFVPDDLASFAQLHTDPEVMRFSLAGPLPFAKAQERFEGLCAYHKAHGFGMFALFLKGSSEFVGGAGITTQVVDGQELFEFGYRLHGRFWGQELATEAGRAIVAEAEKFPELQTLISIIDPNNIASIRVAEKVGMTLWKETQFHGFDVRVYRTTTR